MKMGLHDATELAIAARVLFSSLDLDADGSAAFARRLQGQYTRWPRRYHDTHHLLACLRAAHALRTDLGSRLTPMDIDAITFAPWFHDAVYWPWRSDNEARSAVMAHDTAVKLGLGPHFADRVHALVMATAHLAEPPASLSMQAPRDDAVDYVLDIDLGILAAPQAAFDRYEREVRREYFFVLPAAWRKGRAAVLRHFLDQPRIYRTAFFGHRMEAPARANLQRSLQKLQP